MNKIKDKVRSPIKAPIKIANWSHGWDSNPGPHPYHGCALPTELSRHNRDNYNKILSKGEYLLFISLLHKMVIFCTLISVLLTYAALAQLARAAVL